MGKKTDIELIGSFSRKLRLSDYIPSTAQKKDWILTFMMNPKKMLWALKESLFANRPDWLRINALSANVEPKNVFLPGPTESFLLT